MYLSASVPRRGTMNAKAWYGEYHALVFSVPNTCTKSGTASSMVIGCFWYWNGLPFSKRSSIQ